MRVGSKSTHDVEEEERGEAQEEQEQEEPEEDEEEEEQEQKKQEEEELQCSLKLLCSVFVCFSQFAHRQNHRTVNSDQCPVPLKQQKLLLETE